MKKVLITGATLALTTLWLGGCAGGPDWQKPDGTSQQLHSDQADCQVMENKADNDQTYDDCMKGRGWTPN